MTINGDVQDGGSTILDILLTACWRDLALLPVGVRAYSLRGRAVTRSQRAMATSGAHESRTTATIGRMLCLHRLVKLRQINAALLGDLWDSFASGELRLQLFGGEPQRLGHRALHLAVLADHRSMAGSPLVLLRSMSRGSWPCGCLRCDYTDCAQCQNSRCQHAAGCYDDWSLHESICLALFQFVSLIASADQHRADRGLVGSFMQCSWADAQPSARFACSYSS